MGSAVGTASLGPTGEAESANNWEGLSQEKPNRPDRRIGRRIFIATIRDGNGKFLERFSRRMIPGCEKILSQSPCGDLSDRTGQNLAERIAHLQYMNITIH